VTRKPLQPDDLLGSDDPALAALLAAAAAPADPGPLPGEAAALAAFRAAVTEPLPITGRRSHRPPPHKGHRSLRLAAAALTGSVVLAGGLAAAATGSLPGAAQQTAKDMLSKIGVTVPGPAGQAGEHPATRGKSGEAGRAGTDGQTTNPGKGSTVSDTATTTTETGVEKGAEISDTASDGKSKAGDKGSSKERPGKSIKRPGPADPTPPAPADPTPPAPGADSSGR
jgi:hypothetical protein